MRRNSRRNPREKKKIEDDSTWEPPWPQRDFPCMVGSTWSSCKNFRFLSIFFIENLKFKFEF